jgi:hypothetical protein
MGRGQMPPLATRQVDKDSVALVEKWIRRLGEGMSAVDAGSADAGVATNVDAAMDAGGSDEDAGMDAASTPDTGASQLDASVDAGEDAGMESMRARRMPTSTQTARSTPTRATPSPTRTTTLATPTLGSNCRVRDDCPCAHSSKRAGARASKTKWARYCVGVTPSALSHITRPSRKRL